MEENSQITQTITTIATIIGVIAAIFGIPAAVVQVMDYFQNKKLNQNQQAINEPSEIIRVEHRYSSEIPDGIIKDFDPSKNAGAYLNKENTIILSFPIILIDVISLSKDEWIRLASFLVVKIINIQPVEGIVDYYCSLRGGADGVIDHFYGYIAPYQKKVFGVPFIKNHAGGDQRNVDYFSLTPGEREVFQLHLNLVDGYYYEFVVGVLFSHQGKQKVKWIDEVFKTGKPKRIRTWAPEFNTSREPILNRPLYREPEFDDMFTRPELDALESIKEQQSQVQNDLFFKLPAYNDKDPA